MTQEELKNKASEYNRRISALREEKYAFIRQALKELPEAAYVGKKVRCYRRGEYEGDAYLHSLTYDDWGDIFNLKKIKKDGTMSQVSAGYWRIDHIEPIEE